MSLGLRIDRPINLGATYNHIQVMDDATGDSAQRRLPDPVVEAYKTHVDMTLIREQLARTIDERVARMIAALRLAEELRDAGRR